MTACMLTTKDNPFDYFEDFYNWYNFDILHGYNTCSYLDRVANTSNAFTDKENEEEIENAVDKIIKDDPFGIYIKVYSKD